MSSGRNGLLASQTSKYIFRQLLMKRTNSLLQPQETLSGFALKDTRKAPRVSWLGHLSGD